MTNKKSRVNLPAAINRFLRARHGYKDKNIIVTNDLYDTADISTVLEWAGKNVRLTVKGSPGEVLAL